MALAAAAGVRLDPWQASDLEVACGETAEGRWAAFEVALLNQRQNGKGEELLARQLAGLFLFGERLQTHTAHRVDTCLEHFERVKKVITDVPDLANRVEKITETNGAQAIKLRSGERLIFRARSKGAGRGFSGNVVYLDEAFNLMLESLAGMLPTMSAQAITGNPQLWYASSPPLDGPESAVLRSLCRRGRGGGSPSLAYIEYSAPPGSASDDPDALRQANPALGIRISEQFSAQEREAMPDEEFRRERLGIWVDPDEAPADQTLPGWAGCADTSSEPADGPVRLSLDVSADRMWAAFGVAGPSTVSGVHLEVADYRAGTDWVVSRAADLHERWGGPLFVADKSPASALIPDLEAAHVVVRVVSVEEHTEACAGLFDAVIERRVRHLADPVLDAAVRGAKQRNYGDRWLWSRRTSSVDICPLVAVTLAAWAVGQPADEKVVSLW